MLDVLEQSLATLFGDDLAQQLTEEPHVAPQGVGYLATCGRARWTRPAT